MSDIVERLRLPNADQRDVREAADEITRLRAEKAELVEALEQAEALLRNGPRFRTTDDERFLPPIGSRETAERIAALLARTQAEPHDSEGETG